MLAVWRHLLGRLGDLFSSFPLEPFNSGGETEIAVPNNKEIPLFLFADEKNNTIRYRAG